MTLAHLPYFTTIKSSFQEIDAQTYHFCLTASKATIHARLAQRGDAPGAWSYQQADRCLAAFATPEFAEFIDTETTDAAAVTAHILSRIDGSER